LIINGNDNGNESCDGTKSHRDVAWVSLSKGGVMRKVFFLALTVLTATPAWAGLTAVGSPLGVAAGVTVGGVVGAVVGTSVPIVGGSVLLIAAAGLVAGIRIIRRKQNRERTELPD
jgi:hypothetical protein